MLVLLLLPLPAIAGQVLVPMHISHAFIERALRDQVFHGSNDTLRLNDDGTGCRFLELANPRVSARGSRLRVQTDGHLLVGAPFGDRCVYALQWRGQVELIETVELVANSKVRVRVVEENVLTQTGQPDRVSNTVWSWIRGYVQPAFDVMVVDLASPLEQLRQFLQTVLVDRQQQALQRMTESFTVKSLDVDSQGILATLGLEVDDSPPTVIEPPEPLLDEQELLAFQARLEQLDAFLTFTIKQSAMDVRDEDAVRELMEILLDSRYQLLEVLNQPVKGGADPVRALFVNTWSQLASVLRGLSGGSDTTSLEALDYVTFIAAADAVQALDALGPGFSLDLSVHGLRRLARILAPADTTDPLEYDQQVDPELRRLFKFSPASEDPLGMAPSRWFSLIPVAHAASSSPVEVWQRLNNWVPGVKDMDRYLPMANTVLQHATTRRLTGSTLDPSYHNLYRALVRATAWQESCWRQFVSVKGRREPLRSGTGDVGIMQINSRVWRGFYSVHALQWNIEQNAKAGAEILLHYLENYAIRKGEHRTTGKVENLARSTYAAYNGGPRQFDRYRRSKAPDYARKVDALFYEKYRDVRAGDDLAVRRCYQ